MSDPVDLEALERLAVAVKALSNHDRSRRAHDLRVAYRDATQPDNLLALIQRVRELEDVERRLRVDLSGVYVELREAEAEEARLTERVRKLEEAGQAVVDEWNQQRRTDAS